MRLEGRVSPIAIRHDELPSNYPMTATEKILARRMINVQEKYAGMKILKAREAVLDDLKIAGSLVKIEPLVHTISSCYRCKTTIEPMLMPQWYVKTKPLAEPAIRAVKEGKTKIVPKKRFEKMYFRWMENITDWNISRQIVWGPRIPAWYCLDCNPNIEITFLDKNGGKISRKYTELKGRYTFAEIKGGLQSLTAPVESEYSLNDKAGQKRPDACIQCEKCGGKNILQETDTFDTWFLSGQWPVTTLGYPDSEDFKYFYPTSVLDTLWDILFFWVARMIMFGLYLTGNVPFKVTHMHARVVDEKGQKMSKSKGNVINPIEMADKYGVDAVRMTLIYGVSQGSDVSVSDDKIRAMRNFANKIWNIGRYILGSFDRAGYKSYEDVPLYSPDMEGLTKEDKAIVKDLKKLIKSVTENLKKFRFDFASEEIYQFIWHRFADEYLEYSKERAGNGDKACLSILFHVYKNCLKLLHPFMPFVTEEIWGQIPKAEKDPLIISKWPK